MRTWILIGALLLGGVALAVRPMQPEVIVRENRVEVPVRVEVLREVPTIIEKVRVETRMVEKSSPPPGTAPRPSGIALAHERMLFLFERDLDLRAEQRRFMEDVLGAREEKIASYQKQIVESGVFTVAEYESQIRAIQAASYSKMGEVLDSHQHQRFQRLLEEGRLGDAVMFDVPPTVVVIQG